MADYPVKVPPELFTEWLSEALLQHDAKSGTIAAMVADRAAQWGADQELKACCDHMRDFQWGFVDRGDGTKIHRAVHLEQSRRPKPLTLAEQATAKLDDAVMRGDCITTTDAMPLLRAVIKRLAELEAKQ